MQDFNRNINKRLINSKMVYFIGAGFSSILNYPVMSEFVNKYLKIRIPARSKSIISAIEKVKGTKDLEIILTELDKMLSTKYSFVLEKYLDTKEKIVGSADRGRIPSDPDNIIKKEDTRIMQEIRITIDTIKKRIFDAYRPKKNLDYTKLDSFFSPIFNLNMNKGSVLIPIFTTNYDHVIEEYFKGKKQNINIINGFDEERIFDSLTLEKPKIKKGLNAFIFHLHGSIYFYEDTEFNRLIYTEISSYQKNENYINKIIYPTIDKTPKDEPFFSYYDYLSRCLDYSKYVIFIGYSFRDFESLIRIKSSLIYNKNLNLIIIDRLADHLKKNIFKNDNRVISIHCHNFKNLDNLKELSNKLLKIVL